MVHGHSHPDSHRDDRGAPGHRRDLAVGAVEGVRDGRGVGRCPPGRHTRNRSPVPARCPTTGLPGEDFGGGCAGGCVGDPDGFDDPFIPAVRWDAPAAFGAAIGRSTNAASFLIRDALIVRHRLPGLWRRVVRGEVDPTRARMIAASITGRPRDVSDEIDVRVTPLAHKIGLTSLERKIDEAMLRLYPEQREMEQFEALDRRFVRLDEASLNHTGVADMAIRGDWKDLFDFDRTLAGSPPPWPRRTPRSACRPRPSTYDGPRRRHPRRPRRRASAALGAGAPAPSKRADLVLHITDTNLAGLDPVGHERHRDRAVLDQLVRDWCGRSDTHLTIQPVIDLAGHDETRPTAHVTHAGPRRPDRGDLCLRGAPSPPVPATTTTSSRDRRPHRRRRHATSPVPPTAQDPRRLARTRRDRMALGGPPASSARSHHVDVTTSARRARAATSGT